MEIGMMFEDLVAGDRFVIGSTCDWWIIDGEMLRRSKSHGYNQCRFVGWYGA